MTAPVETKPTFKSGKTTVLFRRTFPSSVGVDMTDYTWWDITPDGKRFLMMKEAGTPASTGGSAQGIHIVLNWFEELKQRVPGK
jgi:hypothetical protein